MAAKSSWAVSALLTHNNIPQLLNHLLPHLVSMRDHKRNIWSITTSHRIKKRSNTFKHNKCSYTTKPDYVAEETAVNHAKLVERVRQLITKDNDFKLYHLLMVDVLQRLGLDYHFEDEIKLILEQSHMQFINQDFVGEQNLYEVSLCFRVLRQNGYLVSADVFKSFMGKNDEKVLKGDIRGLMELYEASQLGIEEEDILDEATEFSRHMLDEAITFLDDDDETNRIRFTLENPQRRRLTSFNFTKSTIDYDAGMLQELAELEWKMVQPIRTMELKEISRWWEQVGLAQDLNWARNQPLKWYIWPMVALPNPNFSHERIALTKTVTLIYIIDDIFDIYGTLDELILFTEAVKRWDIDVIEQLPHYMKSSLKVVFDITNEIAAEAYNKHGFNPIESLKNSWGTLCNAFLVEAKWFASGHIPTSEEYLKNGVVSSGIPLFLAHMFFLLEDCSTKENTCLVHNNNNNNGIVSSVSKILRLSDDLEGAQHENQDGHDGSYVMCFLKEHDNCSLKNAREYVVEMISDSWKCLNKACLNPNGFSDNFTKGSVNIAKLVALMYTYDDNNSLHLQQEYTRSMICDNC